MAATKRTPFERQRDRVEIAELYLKGKPQQAIALQKGMTPEMVCYDLKVITAEWQKSAILAVDKAKVRELEKVNLLEATYWEAWETSKQPRKRTITRTRKGDKSETSAGIVTQERDGNPAFLAGIMTCIEKRCNLLGLDEPERIELSGRIHEIAAALGIPDNIAVRQAERILHEVPDL